jgi:hypothetical protein
VIRQAADLFRDLDARIEVRNQARVHLWFNPKHGLNRPALRSVREGVDQFLVECTCVGIDATGELYATYGLDDLAEGVLRLNALNHSPSMYVAATVGEPAGETGEDSTSEGVTEAASTSADSTDRGAQDSVSLIKSFSRP